MIPWYNERHNKVIYDDKSICLKCNNLNKVIVKGSINTDICEAETICTKCGHIDYWAYGWYESKGEKNE